jgi:phosphatidylserine synthase 2
MIIALELACELNAFYLKFLLWVPVPNYLNALRLFYYFLICLPAVREAYQYMVDPSCKRLGMYAWMATINILTELLIIFKYSQGEFTEPFPQEVVVFWILFSLILIAYPIYTFALDDTKKSKSE